MSYEDILKTRLLQQECHFTWSLREEDFAVSDLLIRLDEQIELESGKARVTRAYSSLGFVYYLLGNQQEALNYLQKSVQLAKEYQEEKSDEVLIVTYGDIAWLLYYMKEFSKCEDYLRLLESIHGASSEGFNCTIPLEVLREKGWAFLKFSRKYYKGAKECFRQALEINPDDSDLNTGYAIALYRTAELPEPQESPTIKQLQRAIKLDPDDPVLLVLLALRMMDNKQDEKAYNTAVQMVNCALLKSSENQHVIRYAAQFFRQFGNLDEVIILIEKALQDTPNSAFLHHQLAKSFKKKNQEMKRENSEYNNKYLRKCIYHLEKAVALKPVFVVAMADLALQYGQLGIVSKAEIMFEKAFQMAKVKNEHLQAVYCFYGRYQRSYQKSEEKAVYNFMQGMRLQPNSLEGKLCETNLRQICENHSKKMKNQPDSKTCEIYGFIHEVKGEKLQAAEFYERALTKRLAQGESSMLAEMRLWLMSFKEAGQSVLKMIFDQGTHEEELGSGGLKIVKGTMDKKTVNLVEIDITNIKRILRWEQQALNPGPHAVILAIPLDHGEFTDKTKEILEDLEFLGEKFWSHVIVVFTKGDSSMNEYHRIQETVFQWLLEKCERRYCIFGGASNIVEMGEFSKMIQEMIRSNNSVHLLLPEMAHEDAHSLSEALVGVDMHDDLVTPEIIDQEGQPVYRVSCSHAGWLYCKFTNLGFNMKGAGEVLYSTVFQESSSPIPANCYPAGPLYDIKCVQGELCQLKLPHCETSIDDGIHSMSVIHYSGVLVELLKLQNITSTHVTVTIPGTSKFRLVNIINWFKDNFFGQVMLFYIQPVHRIHVFLRPYKLNPEKVAALFKDYEFIQTTCECTLNYNSKYRMSCIPVEEHGASEMPEIKIRPQTQTLQCTHEKAKGNDFPTFEIFLPNDVMKVRLYLKKEEKDVWDCDINLKELVTYKSFSSSTHEQCVSFLKNNRCEIIQRVVNIDAIIDGFADVIPPEPLNRIRAATIHQEKTRGIYCYLDTRPALKQQFFKLLKQNEPQLVIELMFNI